MHLRAKTKEIIEKFLKLWGFELRRIPPYQLYGWLKNEQIKTIIDVGANSGQFAKKMLNLLPHANIYSFEPLEQCLVELNKAIGHLPNVRIFPYALGDLNGKMVINKCDYSPSSSLLQMEDLHKEQFPDTVKSVPETIDIRRLDDVLNQNDIEEKMLVKIDVQGYENEVIKGSEKTLSNTAVIIVETSFVPLYKDQPLFEDIYSTLTERGFRLVGAEEPLRHQENGSVLQFDAVFASKQV